MVGAALCLSPPAAAPRAPGELGSLTLHGPFPCLARTVWGDHDRYVETSLSEFPGKYAAADAALLDQDGQLWVTGRLDDVMNVAGHRLIRFQIESRTCPGAILRGANGRKYGIATMETRVGGFSDMCWNQSNPV